jgi:hypothetical protein
MSGRGGVARRGSASDRGRARRGARRRGFCRDRRGGRRQGCFRPDRPLPHVERIRRLGHCPAHIQVRERRPRGAAPGALSGARARDLRRSDERLSRPLPRRPAGPTGCPVRTRAAAPTSSSHRAPSSFLDLRQQVNEAGALVADYLAADADPGRLRAALGSALLREDRGFHTIQCAEPVRREALRGRGRGDLAAMPPAGAGCLRPGSRSSRVGCRARSGARRLPSPARRWRAAG